ncbi:hypothetical protein LCGC14_2493810 [marine sediment metagenome]|uniref:Uncharacterized protein n=1 Tax=marine sediment metagenome TaxID=412755 RepID=A0A0F9B3X5_9ZZZZ
MGVLSTWLQANGFMMARYNSAIFFSTQMFRRFCWRSLRFATVIIYIDEDAGIASGLSSVLIPSRWSIGECIGCGGKHHIRNLHWNFSRCANAPWIHFEPNDGVLSVWKRIRSK